MLRLWEKFGLFENNRVLMKSSVFLKKAGFLCKDRSFLKIAGFLCKNRSF